MQPYLLKRYSIAPKPPALIRLVLLLSMIMIDMAPEADGLYSSAGESSSEWYCFIDIGEICSHIRFSGIDRPLTSSIDPLSIAVVFDHD
jgi:hypothetical protein